MELCLLLVFAVPATSCPKCGQTEHPPPPRPEDVAAAREAREDGIRHLEQKRYFAAIPRFDEVLRLDPGDLESFVARCKAYRATKQSGRRNRTPGDCSTCMETSRNGARTSTAQSTMEFLPQAILPGRWKGRGALCVAVVGHTFPRTPGHPTVSTTRLHTPTGIWACELFSDSNKLPHQTAKIGESCAEKWLLSGYLQSR